MATMDNTLRSPDVAASQGRTTDDLAADALNRYLANEWLNKIEHEGPRAVERSACCAWLLMATLK
jgi:hypothetical protein